MAVMDVARSDQEFFGRKRKVVFQGEPAISRSDTLLHRPAVWRGVEEHVGERRSGWRFDRHAEEKAVTMAYGMLQRAKGSSYPEILGGLCGNGEIAMINRFISLLLEFLNDHK